MILAWHRSNQTSKRLRYIPGVGPMLATALVASVADPRTFRSGRNFSAWIGLVPKQHSSGGKDGSAVSASRATAICAACSWPARSPSSAMPRSTAPSIGPGSRRCWAAADQGRRHRACQQVCADGLGHDGQGRAVQASRRACGVNEIAPDARRDVKVGRATARNAEPVDPAIRTTHLCHRIDRMRVVDRDLIRGGHYGQRSCEPHLKGRTHGCTDQAANVKKVLANSEPSTHGTSRHFVRCSDMSEVGRCKPEVTSSQPKRRDRPPRRQGTPRQLARTRDENIPSRKRSFLGARECRMIPDSILNTELAGSYRKSWTSIQRPNLVGGTPRQRSSRSLPNIICR